MSAFGVYRTSRAAFATSGFDPEQTSAGPYYILLGNRTTNWEFSNGLEMSEDC